MYNKVKSIINRIEWGYDPITYDHAVGYLKNTYNGYHHDSLLLERFYEEINPRSDLSILDLGAGPGLYCLDFAENGHKPTWCDISRNYFLIALTAFELRKIRVNMQLTYIDYFSGSYDVIFSRVALYYAIDDDIIGKIYSSIKSGGLFFGVMHNENRIADKGSLLVKLQFHIYSKWGLKIGHPPMSKMRINKAFRSYAWSSIVVEDHGIDTLIICKK